ncbi:hypothetical protein FSP39_006190 [Pinctada imbricata]|uniref:Apoptosis-inducing factor 1, mitochondrial n=1 Tax=Pinctada imbricata TaxID=66713 RepID=A0AA88YLT4_PINIB|nr:hypothetical protein FSP39_006190 [Pinctada imbricata]
MFFTHFLVSPPQQICARCLSHLSNMKSNGNDKSWNRHGSTNRGQYRYKSTEGGKSRSYGQYIMGGIAVIAGGIFVLTEGSWFINYYIRGNRHHKKDDSPIQVSPHPLAIQASEELTQKEKEEIAATAVGSVDSTFVTTPVTMSEDSKEKKTEESKAATTPEEEFPKHIPYLLIGGGTTSVGAYRAIKAKDPKAKILVISQEDTVPYFRPPLSKELWFVDDRELAKKYTFKDWNGKQKTVFYEPRPFYYTPQGVMKAENGGVALLSGKKVIKINPNKKTVYIDDGKEITYDKCLIATGGRPRSLPTIEKASQEVKDRTVLFRTLSDFSKLEDMVQKSKSVAIIGGGFLGSELACALGFTGMQTGMKVYQVFPEDGNLGAVLPKYLSKWTSSKIAQIGVDIMPRNFVNDAAFKDGQVQLTLSSGSKISVDNVVVAVGLQPNTELAKTSGLEVDENHGGFRVNAELEARSDIWVAGDASCFYDIKLGRRRVEHHDHAMVSGRLAGENMTGAAKPYWHQSTFWSDLGPTIGFEAIGIIDSELETVAVFDKATKEAIEGQTGQKLKDSTPSQGKEGTVDKKPELTVPGDNEEYGKGVLFYLKDKEIVGILLWNLMGRMHVARKVLRDGAENEDLYEVAKLFNISDAIPQEE